MTRHWGRWYCGYFAHDLVPALLELRASPTPARVRSTLARFSGALPLSEVRGGVILMRWFSELVAMKGWNSSDLLYVQAAFSPLNAARMERAEAWPTPEFEAGRADDYGTLLAVIQYMF
jgi:hypothetical protein